MKTGKNTPSTIRHLNENIAFLSRLQREMKRHLKAVNDAHKTVKAIRQKSWDDGEPQTNAPFYGPLFDLKADAEGLINLADHVKGFADVLLNRQPEDWK